ncbi:di-trans,poly-cis-decaprenylcistransferase [Catenovulum sp. SM1970]|uniref:polyprenyl diphosphate synthase n=1 Tax=Marinifaba aquimaris TaxID=2741323 RepID=UPI0015739C7A|nr:polyprenyl diphosphate synthase [Marinifaba aquimaris]NTS77089.1 di-trans,poly-cis-decaprenylcistransferase [Marinifaba aquimaris]
MSSLEKLAEIPQSDLPGHIAVIMDGNGRWAQAQGKPRAFGHKAGVESVRNAVRFCRQHNVQALTVFAFSSENWKRPEQEVSLLMELFMLVLSKEVKNLHKNNVKLQIIGDISAFSERLQKQIIKAQELTKDNTGLVFNVAANYGGRWDISQAAAKLAEQVKAGELNPEQITEEKLHQMTCLSELPDLDLLIRTGGEHRISNFLLWQVAYAELFFAEEYWPDFDEECFARASLCFANRNRRYGLTGEQIEQQKK